MNSVSLGVQLIKVRCVAVLIAFSGNTQRLLSHLLLDQQFILLLLVAGDGIKVIVHFTERSAHHFFIVVQRLIACCHRHINLRRQRFTIKQWGKYAAANAPQPEGIIN